MAAKGGLRMTELQTVGFYGMICCGILYIIIMSVHNWVLRKYVRTLEERGKAKEELLETFRNDAKIYSSLLEVLRSQNVEYEMVLRAVGLIKEPEKPKLHG